MKHIDIPFLILSFLLLVIACSALSMSAVAREYRFTWVAMNPWNGVEGIAYTVRHFLHTSPSISMLITLPLLSIIWWRIYALLRATFRK